MQKRLTFPLHLKLDPQEPKEGKISGYASVFNVRDGQGDVVCPGAFEKSLSEYRCKGSFPKMLWQHQPHTPIGRWTCLKEDDHGLYVEGEILLSLTKGREAYEMIKNHMIEGLSIGCQIVQSEKGSIAGEKALTEVRLVEISLVTFAANQEAKIHSVKGIDFYKDQILEALYRAKALLKEETMALSYPSFYHHAA